MKLKKEFWDEFGRDILVGDNGLVLFTAPGRKKYQYSFAKWGFFLANVTTVQEFQRVLRQVRAHELDENNRKLSACLEDPSVPEAEKQFIRKILGQIPPPKPARAPMAALAPSSTPTNTSSTVIYANFQTRRRVVT
jgi:hypothetical protein